MNDMLNRLRGLRRFVGETRSWAGALGGLALALCPVAAIAQDEAKPAVAPEVAPDAAPVEEDGPRWIRVVEEDGGATIKLQVVSREYRREDGKGPSVHLTGAVHIGDATFYSDLQAFLDAKDLVLYEGVKPPGAGRLDHNPVQGGDEQMAKATERRIRFVSTFIEKYRKTHGAYPQSFDELVKGVDGRVAKILEGCLSDAWGNKLLYTMKPAAAEGEVVPRPKMGSAWFEVESLGADGKDDGDGADADIVFSDQPALRKEELVEGEGLQRQIANAMRLEFQLDMMDESKPNWRNSDLSVDQVMDRLEAAGADPEQLFSMMGGGSFMDAAIGLIAKAVGMSKTLSTMLKMVMVDMLSHADQLLVGVGGEMGQMMKVIIDDRNAVVADDLASVLQNEPGVKSIGIIYGAGHLPDLERRLIEDMEFKEKGEQWFTAITVKVADTGMTAAEARRTRKMMKSQIEKQIKAMQKEQ